MLKKIKRLLATMMCVCLVTSVAGPVYAGGGRVLKVAGGRPYVPVSAAFGTDIEFSFDIYCLDFRPARSFDMRLSTAWMSVFLTPIKISSRGVASFNGVDLTNLNANQWYTISYKLSYDGEVPKLTGAVDDKSLTFEITDKNGYSFTRPTELFLDEATHNTETYYDNIKINYDDYSTFYNFENGKIPSASEVNPGGATVFEVFRLDGEEEEETTQDQFSYEYYKTRLETIDSYYEDFNVLDDLSSSISLMSNILQKDLAGVWYVESPDSTLSNVESGKAICLDSTASADESRLVVKNPNTSATISEMQFDVKYDSFSRSRLHTFKLSSGWMPSIIPTITESGDYVAGGRNVFKFEANKWYTINYLIDNDAKYVWVLVDGKEVFCSEFPELSSYFDMMELNNVGLKTYYDNFSYYNYKKRPSVMACNSYTDDNGVDYLSIEMSCPIFPTGTPIELYHGDCRLSVDSINYTDNTFLLIPSQKLVSGATYTLCFDGGISSRDGLSIGDGYTYEYRIPINEFDVKSIVFFENDKIQARVQDMSGSAKEVAMVVQCLDDNGAVFEQLCSEYCKVKDSGTKYELEVKPASSYRVFFVFEGQERLVAKNCVFGSNGYILTSANEQIGAPGTVKLNALFNPNDNSLSVYGNSSTCLGAVSILIAKLEDVSVDGEFDVSKWNFNLSRSIMDVSFTNGIGEFSSIINLPSDFDYGDYVVFECANGETQSKQIKILSTEAINEVIANINSKSSARLLYDYLEEALGILSYPESVFGDYGNELSKYLIDRKPTKGYDYNSLINEVDYELIAFKIKFGAEIDDIMHDGAALFGCTYQDYNSLADSVRKEFNEVLSNTDLLNSKLSPSFGELSAIAKIRHSCTQTWGSVRTAFMDNQVYLGVDVERSLKGLSDKNKAYVFQLVKNDCQNAITIDQIVNSFNKRLKEVSATSEKKPTGGGGGGGGSSSSNNVTNVPMISGTDKVIKQTLTIDIIKELLSIFAISDVNTTAQTILKLLEN